MKWIITSLFLLGCTCDSSKFAYNDYVKVRRGFYRGSTGWVKSCNNNFIYNSYLVDVTDWLSVTVPEGNLELEPIKKSKNFFD